MFPARAGMNRPPPSLPEKIHQKREQDADDQAGGQGEAEGEVFALNVVPHTRGMNLSSLYPFCFELQAH